MRGREERKFPTYRYSFKALVIILLEHFSIDFAGSHKPSKSGCRFLLIGAERINGWSVAWAMADSAAIAIMIIIEEEIILSFGPPTRIILNNTTKIMPVSVQEYINEKGVERKAAIPYELMANGRAERIVGPITQALMNSIMTGEWAEALPNVLSGTLDGTEVTHITLSD